MSSSDRVVLAITGASGAAIGVRIAERLQCREAIETELIVSKAAERTLAQEVSKDALVHLESLVASRHPVTNIGAAVASGSFRTKGMIVAPCSMRTLAAIASGISDNLVTRAADVHLKERRRLILVTREAPLHLGHLRNMTAATEMGAIIMPPVPAFYHRPETVAEIVDQLAARTINLLDLAGDCQARSWSGEGS